MLPPEKQLINPQSSVCSPAWQYTPNAVAGPSQELQPLPGAVGHRVLSAPLLRPQSHTTIPLCLHSLLISGFLQAPGFPSSELQLQRPSWPSILGCKFRHSFSFVVLQVKTSSDTSQRSHQSPQWNFQHSPTGVILTTDFINA